MSAIWQDINSNSLQLPEFLVFDASLVLELLPDTNHPHRHHAIAVSFLKRVRAAVLAREAIVLLPMPALSECYHALCKRVIVPFVRGSGATSWQDYYKKHPTVISRVTPLMVQFYKLLKAFPIEIPEPEALALSPESAPPLLADRMSDFMDKFTVLSVDAMIISEAERLGVFTLVSLDPDWMRADGFTLIAPP